MLEIMKKISYILASLCVLAAFVSCDKQLAVKNVNNQTTYDFGNTESDLQEAVIACYNRIRLEGTFARVGYMHDVVRGDEAWNPQNAWYLTADHLNSPGTIDITDQWIWRDCFHVVNRCNFVLSKITGEEENLKESYKRMRGEALFLRALAYYTLATYYQTVPLFTDYAQYGSLETIYSENVPQDEILDQVEKDLTEAMTLLPKRDIGGEWAKGRATCGAAAGYYARVLMFRHKYSDALAVLKDLRPLGQRRRALPAVQEHRHQRSGRCVSLLHRGQLLRGPRARRLHHPGSRSGGSHQDREPLRRRHGQGRGRDEGRHPLPRERRREGHPRQRRGNHPSGRLYRQFHGRQGGL